MFWNLLNIDNVANGSLHQLIEKSVSADKYFKINNEMREQNTTYTRNHLYTYLRPLTELIFSELLEEAQTEILKDCYVYGRSNNSLYHEFEDFFIDKLPQNISNMNVKDIIENKKKAGVFQDEFLQASRKSIGTVILLLGGIGSGKSTFLRRFFKIVLENQPDIVCFNIDFRLSSPDTKEVESFILDKIREIWEVEYLTKCHDFLKEKGFNSELPTEKEKIKRVFSILAMTKTITLVIDNVDQHTRDYQEKIIFRSLSSCKIFPNYHYCFFKRGNLLIFFKNGYFRCLSNS